MTPEDAQQAAEVGGRKGVPPDLTVGTLTATALVSHLTGYVIFPTADPHVVGAVWNNAGTLTISAG